MPLGGESGGAGGTGIMKLTVSHPILNFSGAFSSPSVLYATIVTQGYGIGPRILRQGYYPPPLAGNYYGDMSLVVSHPILSVSGIGTINRSPGIYHHPGMQFPSLDGVITGSDINYASEQAQGLTAAWPLWDGGNSVQESLSGKSSKISGYVKWTADEGDVQCLEFNGQNSYIKLDSKPFGYERDGNKSDYVVGFSVWFKTKYGGVILGQSGGLDSTPNGTTTISGSVPALYVGTDGFVYASLFWYDILPPPVVVLDPFTGNMRTYNDDQWHHIYVTWYEGEQYTYIDGELGQKWDGVSQNPYSNNYTYTLGTGYTGAWTAGNNGWYHFNGLLSQPRVYRTKKSLSDVNKMADYFQRWNLWKQPIHRSLYYRLFPAQASSSLSTSHPILNMQGTVKNRGYINRNIPLYIQGKSTITGSIPLYINSSLSPIRAQIPLYINGKGLATSTIPLYIRGASGVNANIPLFINGIAAGINASIPLFISTLNHVDGTSESLNLFIKGIINKNILTAPLFIAGAASSSSHPFIMSTASLYLSGGGTYELLNLFISGKSLAGKNPGSLNLFIKGGNPPVFGHVPLYLCNNYKEIDDFIPFYIRGLGKNAGYIPVNKSFNLFISGGSGTYNFPAQLINKLIPLYIAGNSSLATQFSNILPLYVQAPINNSINNNIVLYMLGMDAPKVNANIPLVIPKTKMIKSIPLYIHGF
jgi:hypothetical protein